MRFLILIQVTLIYFTLTSCASAYREINPRTINYISGSVTDSVSLEYKYDVLFDKYARNEYKKGVKIVALKISNNSHRDLIFGGDLKLIYSNGNPVHYSSAEKAFKALKQHPASYLWYLLLSPVNLYTAETDSRGFEYQTNSFPIGVIIGPSLAGGNMLASSAANRKFKTELLENELSGIIIKKGETKYGLLPISSPSYDAIQLQIIR